MSTAAPPADAQARIDGCPHPSEQGGVAIIYSPDDGGYYVECRTCWAQGPVMPSRRTAVTAFLRMAERRLLRA